MVMVLTNDEVSSVLTMPMCIEALDDIFLEYAAGDAVRKPKTEVCVPEVKPGWLYRSSIMEGASRKYGTFAMRFHSNMVGRSDDGKRQLKYSGTPGNYLGMVFVFDIHTAELQAIMPDGVFQHMRTGASAGIAAKYLAKADSEDVGIIGAGGMARTHLEAICDTLDIKRARVYSPTASTREAFATEEAEKLGIEVVPVADPADAVRGADIVATTTNSTEPVFDAAWWEPGMFLTYVTQYEIDEAVVAGADSHFTLDQLIFSGMEGGAWIRYLPGRTDKEIEERISGFGDMTDLSLIDVLAGRIDGRRSDDEKVLFNNNGHEGLQFPSVAAVIYSAAKERGLGTQIPSELFLQDIKN
jgi:ornithine cyclodeaminase/alanine dehydrogenase-like protein (mu-crystallin family)